MFNFVRDCKAAAHFSGNKFGEGGKKPYIQVDTICNTWVAVVLN